MARREEELGVSDVYKLAGLVLTTASRKGETWSQIRGNSTITGPLLEDFLKPPHEYCRMHMPKVVYTYMFTHT